MAEAAVPKQPLPTQSAPHQPHPDMPAAMESAQRSREYGEEREWCMNGTAVKLYELATKENKVRPRDAQIPNPPVGEACIGLLQHSAAVQSTPTLLADRPEKSIIEPYASQAERENFPPPPNPKSPAIGQALLNAYAQAIQAPVNQLQPNAVIGLLNKADGPGKPTRKFKIYQGTALDVGFSTEIMESLKTNTRPPVPTRSANDLYNTTEQCFRLDQNVSLGQCFQVGKDQAALYLNGQAMELATPSAPYVAPTAATPKKANIR